MGVKCKPNIRCANCSERIHKKGIPKCRKTKWVAGCSFHYHWVANARFSSRKDAMKHFRDHKHDAVWTYSSAMQEALANLTEVGIAYYDS